MSPARMILKVTSIVKMTVVNMSMKFNTPPSFSFTAGNVDKKTSMLLIRISAMTVQSTILSTKVFFSSSRAFAIALLIF